MVNRLPQATFKAEPFDAAGFNLHCHANGPTKQVVILVHGLNGGGYKSWDQLPVRLFNGTDGPPIDVAVFDYKSGIRRLGGGADRFEAWASRLRQHLRTAGEEYSDVFLVGHSLGGVLSEHVAMTYVQTVAMTGDLKTNPLAALILIAAPRAGSGWAVPAFQRPIREFRILRRLTARSAEVDTFYSSYVERRNVAAALPGLAVLPVYSAEGGEDRLVSRFSASFGIPEDQRLPLSAKHGSIAKPGPKDNELINWMHSLIADRLEVRAQSARERLHAASRMVPSTTATTPEMITQFWSDPSGLRWEELYNEVRRAATTPALEIRDARDAPDATVDLLIAVHDAGLVLASSPVARSTVDQACAERRRVPSLSVGISPVGSDFMAAEAVLRTWVTEQAAGSSIYVEGAPDAAGLQGVIARWLQLIINRDHRRTGETKTDLKFGEGEDLYGHSENGGSL